MSGVRKGMEKRRRGGDGCSQSATAWFCGTPEVVAREGWRRRWRDRRVINIMTDDRWPAYLVAHVVADHGTASTFSNRGGGGIHIFTPPFLRVEGRINI